jgi:hypothetical protein
MSNPNTLASDLFEEGQGDIESDAVANVHTGLTVKRNSILLLINLLDTNSG